MLLALRRIDPNTYPVWWIEEVATSPDLAGNLKDGNVINQHPAAPCGPGKKAGKAGRASKKKARSQPASPL
jgi:hypothetical protein